MERKLWVALVGSLLAVLAVTAVADAGKGGKGGKAKSATSEVLPFEYDLHPATTPTAIGQVLESSWLVISKSKSCVKKRKFEVWQDINHSGKIDGGDLLYSKGETGKSAAPASKGRWSGEGIAPAAGLIPGHGAEESFYGRALKKKGCKSADSTLDISGDILTPVPL